MNANPIPLSGHGLVWVLLLLAGWSLSPAKAACRATTEAGRSAPGSPAAQDLVLPIEGGLISGCQTRDGMVRSFLGIPYAAPPVGELRWRPPAPVQSWQGVRRATRYAPSAMQPGSQAGPEGMSEDCLYLNIWTGGDPAQELRPVLLWIHGGGFTEGTGAKPDFNGEALCRQGLVVVTINYRLNVFGFLAHPELSRESAHGVSGNYGLLDMVAALDWVRRNIRTFGGDLERITLAGESAGSISVSALAASPVLKSKIVGMIAESLVYADAPRLDEMEAAGTRFAGTIDAPSLADLRRLSASRLCDAFGQHGAGLTCRPLVDNWLLFEDTLTSLSRGRHQDIPLLTGFNADETSWMEPVSVEDYLAQSHQLYGKLAGRYLALYPASTAEEATTARIAAAQDRVAWEHLTWAKLHGEGGRKVFAYNFTREHPIASTKGWPRRLGVYHGAEIPYVFDSLPHGAHPWTPDDHKLAQVMSSYWANFVKHGNPNGEGLPSWPEFGHSHGLLLELGDHVTPITPGLSQEKMDFWAADQKASHTSVAERHLRQNRF